MNSFEALKIITFLSEIILLSFVLGFLPILCFFFLNKKVPKFAILTFLLLIIFFKIISIFIDDLFKTFKKILKKDDKLILKNIGSFKILEKKQRIGRNPKTGQIYPISKRKTISFKMSENIKDKINNE